MIKIITLTISVPLISALLLSAQQRFEKDIIKTSQGDLEITFIGHASLIFNV